MASTYSPLKIELIGTGEQAGTWGTTTNTNLGTALEEAITGRATATFPSDANYTLTYTDSNASQVFRNLVLNVTSSGNLSATRDLIIPAIEKQYFVENNTSNGQSIVVKTAAGTGVTIPNGRVANVYCDGTNVRFADDYSVLNAGTVALPSLTTTSDTNTGLYFPAADQVALTAGGSQVLRASYSGTTGTVSITGDISVSGAVSGPLLFGNGTVSAPSLAAAADTNTGIYFPAADTLGFSIGGNKVLEIIPAVGLVPEEVNIYGGLSLVPDSDGTLQIGRYSAGNGGSTLNTKGGSTFLAIQIEQVPKMYIMDTGNVGINTVPGTESKFTVIGDDSTLDKSTVNFRNSSNQELFRARNDGLFLTGGASLSPYNNTTGSAANVFVDSNGTLYRSTSSIKYKTEVTDYDKGLNAVMAMRPVYYKDNRTDEDRLYGDQQFAGFIAEEIHAAGLQEFVQYNAKNEPDSLSYGNMAALFSKAIQELKAELDAVKAELAAMKGN